MLITLPDGSKKTFTEPLSGLDLAKTISSSLAKRAIAVKINTHIYPLSLMIGSDCQAEIITLDSPDAKSLQALAGAFITAAVLSQSQAHLKLAGIGLHELGFYVMVDAEPTIKNEALQELTKAINHQLKQPLTLNLIALSPAKWKQHQATNPYWAQLDGTQFNHQVYVLNQTVICPANFSLPTVNKAIKVVKLLSVSGAYWQDDSNNKQLQRIYGIAANSEIDLKAQLAELADRAERDHRKIGKQLEIFMFDQQIGQGLPVWLPNGMIIKNEIMAYIKSLEWDDHYLELSSPVLGSLSLYQQSTHWEHYREEMFPPIQAGNEALILRPMQCPHHCRVYLSQTRSYRDLPLRFAEHGYMFRYEKSGALTGLERTRQMQLTDAHLFVRPDQVVSEIKKIYQLIQTALATFHIHISYVSLSLRDPADTVKFHQNEVRWTEAEAILAQALTELGIKYVPVVGEAAFYGPKIDIQVKTALKHEVTIPTIQLDLFLPERFNLEYIDQDGTPQRPYIIHRGVIGTYERFIATLLEQTKGALPLWLAPAQVVIIPVTDNHQPYAEELFAKLHQAHIRVKLDDRDARVGYKIRYAQTQKIPYQLVIGDQEVKDHTVTYRQYGHQDQTTVSLKDLIEKLQAEIDAKVDLL